MDKPQLELPPIHSWSVFEQQFRGMLLNNPAFDSPICRLRCAGDPIVVTVGGRARAQVESGIGWLVWQFDAHGATYNDVLAMIVGQLNGVLEATVKAATERNKSRIVRPPILTGGNGERFLERMRGQ